MAFNSGRIIFFIVAGLIVLATGFGFWCYQEGKESVYREIASTPVQRDTLILHDTIPGISFTRWLKPKEVFKVPEEVQRKIQVLAQEKDSLENLVSILAQPWGTEVDSTRYYVYIYSDPWEKTNNIDLNLKPIPYSYPIITNSQQILEGRPWYYDALEIGGGIAIGYGLARIQ